MSVNALLVRSPLGFHEVTDVPPGAIRREAPMGYSATSIAEVETVGRAQLAILADVREEITVQLDPKDPSDLYGVGFRKADVVAVPDHTGTLAKQRIQSITATWVMGGRIDAVPQLKDTIATEGQRFAEVVAKQTAGALGGVTRAPQPVADIIASSNCCPPDVGGSCPSTFTLTGRWWPPGSFSGEALSLGYSGGTIAALGSGGPAGDYIILPTGTWSVSVNLTLVSSSDVPTDPRFSWYDVSDVGGAELGSFPLDTIGAGSGVVTVPSGSTYAALPNWTFLTPESSLRWETGSTIGVAGPCDAG